MAGGSTVVGSATGPLGIVNPGYYWRVTSARTYGWDRESLCRQDRQLQLAAHFGTEVQCAAAAADPLVAGRELAGDRVAAMEPAALHVQPELVTGAEMGSRRGQADLQPDRHPGGQRLPDVVRVERLVRPGPVRV